MIDSFKSFFNGCIVVWSMEVKQVHTGFLQSFERLIQLFLHTVIFQTFEDKQEEEEEMEELMQYTWS